MAEDEVERGVVERQGGGVGDRGLDRQAQPVGVARSVVEHAGGDVGADARREPCRPASG